MPLQGWQRFPHCHQRSAAPATQRTVASRPLTNLPHMRTPWMHPLDARLCLWLRDNSSSAGKGLPKLSLGLSYCVIIIKVSKMNENYWIILIYAEWKLHITMYDTPGKRQAVFLFSVP
jgi:hypothetical protein